MYFSVAASALLAEFLLQGIGAAYILYTINFASVNGLYRFLYEALNEFPLKHQAMLLYGGAML
jgi:hypothetical protein